MAETFEWIETLGGPHILAPAEALPGWRGIDGWRENAPNDPSDYARACRAGDRWLNLIPSRDDAVVVFGGDVGAIAWFTDVSAGDIGAFVQWLGCDSEQSVLRVLRDRSRVHAAARDATEVLEFDTGASGAMVLFDAAENGGAAEGGRLTLPLRCGRYRLTAYVVRKFDCTLVLRKLRKVPC